MSNSIFNTGQSQDWEISSVESSNSSNPNTSIFDPVMPNNWWLEKKSWFISGIFWKKDKDISNAKQDSDISNDIFKEMWVEWLDFAETQNLKEKKTVNPYLVWSHISSLVFWIILLITIWSYINYYIKTTDSDAVASLPGICTYIWSSVIWYDNSSCKTFPSITAEITKNKNDIKNTIVQNLKEILPNKIETWFVPASKEIKFILNKTSNRSPIVPIFENFKKTLENANKTQEMSKYNLFDYNYECNNLKVNELWDFDIKCSIYWDQLIWWNWITSRRIAVNLINTIQNNSPFTINKIPSNINISKFSSVDWIKISFSTISDLDLSLKYNNLNTNKN